MNETKELQQITQWWFDGKIQHLFHDPSLEQYFIGLREYLEVEHGLKVEVGYEL
jgi:hypothetical protein